MTKSLIGKEWDKNRNSPSDGDGSDTDTPDATVSNVVLSSDAVTTQPSTVVEHTDEVGVSDITDTWNQENAISAISHGSIEELELHNDIPETSNSGTVPAAAQRTSTVDLDTMEQGQFTNVLRRRTMPQEQVQVSSRSLLPHLIS